MKQAFLFPGQGSQFVAMGKDFADNFPVAKQVFEEVDDALEKKLSHIIFEGPSELLSLTQNTQPALMATSIAIMKVIEQETGKSIEHLTDFVAGHSLGEFTALAASKSITLRDTSKLLNIRGSSMQEAVPSGKGSMAAILGMEFENVETICKQASSIGLCQIANDNCPGQIVISGETDAVNKAIEIIKSQGKKAILLSVSAPFHCDLMKPVKQIIKNALAEIDVLEPKVPVIANVTANQVTDPAQIKANLVDQVTGRVRWTESINYLINQKTDKIIEIGAGKVLSTIAKRIDKNLTAISIGTITELKDFLGSYGK